MLQGLVTLSATIAIQNACCVRVLMRVLQEAALAHEIVESRGVCKAGSCWMLMRSAGRKGGGAVWCVRAGALA